MTFKKPLIGITLDSCDPSLKEKAKWYSFEFFYALRYRYIDAVEKAGGIPVCLPHCPNQIETYVERLDGLLVTGGGFDVDPKLYNDDQVHPTVTLNTKRTHFEYALTEQFLKTRKPFLGICGGMQLLNVICGGSLHQHLPDETSYTTDHSPDQKPVETAHIVHIQEESLLHSLTHQKTFSVNSVHHQAIKVPGKHLIVSAFADDGVIEAIEHDDHPFCVGVQWHPEFQLQDLDIALFEHFIKTASHGK